MRLQCNYSSSLSFLPPNLPIYPSPLSFIFMSCLFTTCFNLHIEVYKHVHSWIESVWSRKCYLFVCFKDWPFGIRPVGLLFHGEGHLSHSQISQFCCSLWKSLLGFSHPICPVQCAILFGSCLRAVMLGETLQNSFSFSRTNCEFWYLQNFSFHFTF